MKKCKQHVKATTCKARCLQPLVNEVLFHLPIMFHYAVCGDMNLFCPKVERVSYIFFLLFLFLFTKLCNSCSPKTLFVVFVFSTDCFVFMQFRVKHVYSVYSFTFLLFLSSVTFKAPL